MGGGAWPFLVGGVICQVNYDNERDLTLLNSSANFFGQSRTDLAAAWRSRQCLFVGHRRSVYSRIYFLEILSA
jgi:hypothetical protein